MSASPSNLSENHLGQRPHRKPILAAATRPPRFHQHSKFRALVPDTTSIAISADSPVSCPRLSALCLIAIDLPRRIITVAGLHLVVLLLYRQLYMSIVRGFPSR